jgi:anti-anti-sigma factor
VAVGGLAFGVSDQDAGQIIMELHGELTGVWQTRPLKAAVERHFDDDAVRCVLVNVRDLGFMDNDGVAALVALLMDCRQHGMGFRVAGAEGQVRKKLRVTGVLRLLEHGA